MRDEYSESDVHADHLAVVGDTAPEATHTGHQRSPRNDPDMRDGDSGRGSPLYEGPQDEYDTDRDVGDTTEADPAMLSEEEGVLEAVPANQEDLPLEATPPAHVGMDATAAVDEAIDERGTATTEDRDTRSSENEFVATIGAETPAARTVNKEQTQFAESEPPIDGYDRLTVKQIIARLSSLSEEEVRRVHAFEGSHRKRKTLMAHLERRLHEEGSTNRSGRKARSTATAEHGASEQSD